ncbi:DUF4296 domain-containing protein [Snuella sedimenti]|uniref:DUF4296 domain-containing protein n=1 Tax=Snuella sedimenti TaxID=2798802 RepID=A0A8J7LPB5_9FLAO|nr:DUF4296 domain-containing protein [Snuella sedimenti]MBJ6369118.1 DUF4296 domain-containing protein [Snuella sedimenti]
MIFKRVILYLGIVLFVTACYKYKAPKKPKHLISKDKMVNILLDLKLLSSTTGKNKRILDEKGVDAETYVFSKYNIDSLQFALSNEYYTFHIEDYDEIYKKLEDSLDILKKAYETLLKEETERELKEKKAKDSIERAKKKLKDSTGNDTKKKLIEKEEEGVLIDPV